jgi:hypothetical protein
MRALALGLAGLVVGGCSLVPSVQVGGTAAHAHGPTARPAPLAVAQATHEYPGPRVPQRVAGAASGAVAAVRSFAAAYTNWNASTVSADMLALGTRSVGQARSLVELAAAQTAQDYELKRGGVANQGIVEAVSPLPGQPGEFVVVTRERTTATATAVYQGLAPAWHVALATVTEVAAGRWAVSGWQPES